MSDKNSKAQFEAFLLVIAVLFEKTANHQQQTLLLNIVKQLEELVDFTSVSIQQPVYIPTVKVFGQDFFEQVGADTDNIKQLVETASSPETFAKAVSFLMNTNRFTIKSKASLCFIMIFIMNQLYPGSSNQMNILSIIGKNVMATQTLNLLVALTSPIANKITRLFPTISLSLFGRNQSADVANSRDIREEIKSKCDMMRPELIKQFDELLKDPELKAQFPLLVEKGIEKINEVENLKLQLEKQLEKEKQNLKEKEKLEKVIEKLQQKKRKRVDDELPKKTKKVK